VPVFLGSEWDEAVPLFRAFAPIAFLATFTSAGAWIFLSLAQVKRQFGWNLGTTAGTVAVVAAGVQWGALGVAVAVSAWRVAIVLPSLAFTCAATFVPWTDVLKAAARPAGAALAAAALLAAAEAVMPNARAPVELGRASALYALCYLGVWLALPDGPRTLRDLLTAIASFLKR